ncbi:hypothetical protein NW767_013470, partial [Fusarium falciforme]
SSVKTHSSAPSRRGVSTKLGAWETLTPRQGKKQNMSMRTVEIRSYAKATPPASQSPVRQTNTVGQLSEPRHPRSYTHRKRIPESAARASSLSAVTLSFSALSLVAAILANR